MTYATAGVAFASSPRTALTLPEASLEQLADDWLRSLARQGFSPETIKTYGWSLSDFRTFLLQRYGVRESHKVRPEHLRAWQDYVGLRPIKPATRSLQATAVRRFLRWLAENDKPVDSTLWLRVERVRVRKGIPRPLPPEDLRQLVAYLLPRWPHRSLVSLRNRALILFLLTSGARLSEALQVHRDDFVQAIVRRKGGRSGMLTPSDLALAAVEEYVAERKDDSTWLWIHHDPQRAPARLTPEALRHVCRQVAHQAGIAPFSPHRLRHSAASILYDQLGDPLAAARHLGHADLSTIENYAETSPRRREEVTRTMDRALLEQLGSEIVRLRKDKPSG